MIEQTLLKLSLPPGVRMYPWQLREHLAKQVDVARELFHYTAQGLPAFGLPPVRFVGGKTWVGLVADASAKELLYRHLGDVVQSVGHLLGSATKVAVETHKLDLIPLEYPQQYWAPEIAIKRRSVTRRARSIEDIAHTSVLKGLIGLGEKYGVDIPGDDALGLKVDVRKNIGMRLITTTGPTNEYVSLVSAQITLNAKLTGLWSVGTLRSRGYGRIAYDRSEHAELNAIAARMTPQYSALQGARL